MSFKTSPTAVREGDKAIADPLENLPKRKPRQLKTWQWSVVSLTTTIVVWWLVVVLFKPAEYILPSPLAVAERLWESRALLVENAVPTIAIILVGFAIGLLVGVPAGMCIAAIPLFDRMFYPLIIAFNSVPKVALAPLFVVWFGYGATPRVVITFSIAFFPILVNTITGLRSADDDMVRLARSMGASTRRTFVKVRLPHALPSIFAGTKVATSLAVIGGIIGEFVASDKGWGYLLIQAQGNLDTTLIFAILVLLAAFATILFYAVELIERIAIPWHASQRVSK